MKRFALLCTTLLIVCWNLPAQQWLHRAVPDGRVDSVWQGIQMPQGFTGKGVIIGVTDWGFDYSHPVFYDTSMTRYRVIGAWDQFRTAGPAPEGFNYGTELWGEEALLNAQCDTFGVYQYGYHGTHVSSIAGGAGAGTPYRGVAHEADLLFASFLVDEQAVIDAFHWMYQRAKKENKRLVINMSWGLYYMSNIDGTGKIADAMQALSDSGVVFVSSGGNNGGENFHLSKDFASSQDTLKSQFLYDNLGESHMWGQAISMISTPGCPFRFGIQAMDRTFHNRCFSGYFTTDSGINSLDTFMIYSDSLRNDTLRFRMQVDSANSYNGRPQVLLKVQTPPSGYTMGLYVVADSGIFHAWNVVELTNGVGNWGDDFVAAKEGWAAGDDSYGMGQPATTPCVIAVAAHESVYKWGHATRGGQIAAFSSAGPNLDGSIKPELSAPGYQVTAAISSYTTRYTGSFTKTVSFQGRDYPFAQLSGTSMASPYVAGVAALMLQANPYLTASEVKEILLSTTYQDYDTHLSGPTRFGYGKVNAYHAVYEALQRNGTQPFTPSEKKYTCYPNPTSDQCYVHCPDPEEVVTAKLLDMQGRILQTHHWQQGLHALSLQALPQGIYLLQLTNGSRSETLKIVKR